MEPSYFLAVSAQLQQQKERISPKSQEQHLEAELGTVLMGSLPATILLQVRKFFVFVVEGKNKQANKQTNKQQYCTYESRNKEKACRFAHKG